MDIATKINIAVLIVNSIAAFFAVVAAIIAVVVYRKSSKQQDKAINYSLLESRLKVWEYFVSERDKPEALENYIIKGREWEIEQFRLLFSEKLVKDYDNVEHAKCSNYPIYNFIETTEKSLIMHPEFCADGDINQSKRIENYYWLNSKRKEVSNLKNSDAASWKEFESSCYEIFREDIAKNYYSKVKEYAINCEKIREMDKKFYVDLEDEIKKSVGRNSKQ